VWHGHTHTHKKRTHARTQAHTHDMHTVHAIDSDHEGETKTDDHDELDASDVDTCNTPRHGESSCTIMDHVVMSWIEI